MEYNYKDYTELDYTPPSFLKRPLKWIKIKRLPRKISKSFLRYTCRRAKVNLGVNHQILEQQQRYGAKQVIHCPCATSDTLIETAAQIDKQAQREALHLPVNDLILTFAGRVEASYNLDKLILAMHHSLYRDHIKLIIASHHQNDCTRQLSHLIKEKNMTDLVFWQRPETRDKCLQYVIACDVIPILQSDMGYYLDNMKYFEALACGKPVLVNNIPYINEGPQMGFGCSVRDCSDIEEIMKALEHFYLNRSHYSRLAPEIRHYAQQQHTWRKRAETFLQYCNWLN